jgi:hypothetical protein
MQDKHFIITHKNEDRDIFINKLKYPKTVYHVGDNPQEGDIVKDPKFSGISIFFQWIIDNYDNLPDYSIFCQAIPDDHVHEPLLAVDATFKGDFGSLCYARSIYNQYSTNWNGNITFPLRNLLHELGYGFFNDNNSSKNLYLLYPGEINFLSRKRIREKPISFYQKIIEWDNNDLFFNFVRNQDFPEFFFDDLYKYHPEIRNRNLSKKALIDFFTKQDPNKKFGYFGYSLEPLWMILFSSKEEFKMLEKSQAVMGNKLYFDLRNSQYDPDFKFNLFPYNDDNTILNLKLLENSWFDFHCPYYIKWRETLKEKTLTCGEMFGFDGQALLDFYERIGYKHISL